MRDKGNGQSGGPCKTAEGIRFRLCKLLAFVPRAYAFLFSAAGSTTQVFESFKLNYWSVDLQMSWYVIRRLSHRSGIRALSDRIQWFQQVLPIFLRGESWAAAWNGHELRRRN